MTCTVSAEAARLAGLLAPGEWVTAAAAVNAATGTGWQLNEVRARALLRSLRRGSWVRSERSHGGRWMLTRSALAQLAASTG